jgi:oligopeptide/dipeptide ABC transporter ATP-binding protein
MIGISGIGLMILRDFFLYRELKKMQLGDVEKEKMPEKRIGLWLTIGLVIVVFGIVNFGMRKNAEGLRILLFIFLGIYLAEKFGFGLFLKVRKHKKSYYAKLIPYNSFYYRFKSTFRYVYVISLIPVLILFLFGKDMISAKIAQKPEGLFPYDFVCMATEADETFWKQLQEKYEMTYLLITHDLSNVPYLCKEVAIMYQGRVVEFIDHTDSLKETAVHPYTKDLFDSIPVKEPKMRRIGSQEKKIFSDTIPEQGCPYQNRCRRCTNICREQIPELTEIETGHFAACHML